MSRRRWCWLRQRRSSPSHHLGNHPAQTGDAIEIFRRDPGLAGTAVIVGLDALGGLSHDVVAEMMILLATISFACATISACGCRTTIRWWWRGSLLRRRRAVAGVAGPRTSLDAAADTTGARRCYHHGHLLQCARADAVLHVPAAAPRARQQRAGLSADPNRVGLSVLLLAKACRRTLRSGFCRDGRRRSDGRAGGCAKARDEAAARLVAQADNCFSAIASHSACISRACFGARFIWISNSLNTTRASAVRPISFSNMP